MRAHELRRSGPFPAMAGRWSATTRQAIRLVALTLAFALATRALGWLAVPVLGLVWGAIAGRARAPIDALASVVLAWALLLAVAALRMPVSDVARLIGGVIGIPAWVPVVLTVLFGAALAWSAAVVGREGARVAHGVRRREVPADAGAVAAPPSDVIGAATPADQRARSSPR